MALLKNIYEIGSRLNRFKPDRSTVKILTTFRSYLQVFLPEGENDLKKDFEVDRLHDALGPYCKTFFTTTNNAVNYYKIFMHLTHYLCRKVLA